MTTLGCRLLVGGFLASAVVISEELLFEDEPERLSEKIQHYTVMSAGRLKVFLEEGMCQ